MSQLSYMEKLLDGVEVEWKTLADVTLPTSNIKWRDINHTHRYIDLSSVSIETKKIIETSEVDATNAPSRAQKVIQEGDIIFATTRPTQMRYCLIDDVYSGQVASTGYCVLRPQVSNILPKWILYCIASKRFKSHVENNESGAAYPAISDTKVKAFEIPIPPLNIQAEIVRILDAFTELTAELTAELVARKQQYAYYREQLLTFEESEVEWKALEEVAVIGTGSHNTQDALEEGKYIFYARGRDPLRLDVFDFDETAIITAGDGAGVGKVFHYAEGKYALHQRAYRIVPNKNIEPRFIYHYIMTHFYRYVHKVSVNSSVTSLRRPMLLNFPIQTPTLTEQQRIVAILDKFDVLTTSLTEGLPCEIELRQQQYEYYRELLLSFPKVEGDT